MCLRLWTTAVLLCLLYFIPHAHADGSMYCNILDTATEAVDEDSKELIKSTQVPHPLHAIAMENGKEDSKSRRRLENMIELKKGDNEENPDVVAAILQEGYLELEEQLQSMMIKKKKDKKNKKKKEKGKSRRRKRFTFNDMTAPSKLWPNAQINFQYASAVGNYERRNLQYIMRMFEHNTPIRFVESDEGPNLEYYSTGGCWSYIGKTGADPQQISPCCYSTDINPCIHELGHVMGLHHEHQNPAAGYYLEPNAEALIDDSWKQWFYAKYGADYRFYDHDVDIDSPMSYSQWDFTKSYSNLQSLILFEKENKDIIGNIGDRQTLYYMYKEITQLYAGAISCPNVTCDYDGYSSYIGGECTCSCPSGIDPTTDCTTVIQTDNSGSSLDWSRDVAFVQPNEGCPNKFDEGSFTMIGGPDNAEIDSIYNFDANVVPGANKELTIHFCKRQNNGNPTTTMPKGSYCYIKDGSQCHTGFQEGSKVFNNGNGFSSNGTLPSGIATSGSDTTITFCCRNDAHFSVPALFPSDDPFILFPTEGKCQDAIGMHSSWQMVLYKNHNDNSNYYTTGFVPRLVTSYYGNVLLNLCYYTKIQNCGGMYNLDANNRTVTFTTPGFPQNYDNNLECTWVFKAPPGNFLKLEFHEFHISMTPDGLADDEVEIRNVKIGNNGKRYTGEGMLRHHITDENLLSVIFYSSNKIPGKGFNATVTLIDEQALCYSGKGENYDGKRNVTAYFSPCLNWKEAANKGCTHEPYSLGDEYDSLDHNYCRNPGNGLRPWCFMDYNGGCFREDCDVCNIRGCFDSDNGICDVNLPKMKFCNLMKGQCNATCNCEAGATSCGYTDARSDCEAQVGKLTPFCDTSEGKMYCAETCGICDALLAEPLQRVCAPPNISDAIILNPKSSYDLGDVVQLKCASRNPIRNQTCTSTGNWVPKLEYVCDGQCNDGYEWIAHNCFKVIKEVSYDEGKAICDADNAHVMMHKLDSNSLVTTLADMYKQNTGVQLSNFWIGLTDSGDNDQFVWNDETQLTYTNWMYKPLVLPYECRMHHLDPDSIYSTRAITKTGKPCLFWNSIEVQNLNQSYPDHEDNFCSSFDRGTVNLFCYYESSGEIVKEDCSHIPFCYNENTALFPRNFDKSNYYYTGLLSYADYGKKECSSWSSLSDDVVKDTDFFEGSKSNAGNNCRSPDRLWCYVNTNGETKTCQNPDECSKNPTECRYRRMKFDGSIKNHYFGTVNERNDGTLCKPWTDTVYNYNPFFYMDGPSASDASNYCRSLYNMKPWCVGIDGNWGYCNVEDICCEESYTNPQEYTGTRQFSSDEKRCLRWNSTELQSHNYADQDFPDGSISNANNYCRAPDGGDYLFCHVHGGAKEWCDLPMKENIKDCVYVDCVTDRWVPTYCNDVKSVVCEKPYQSGCPTDYTNIEQSCFRVINGGASFSAGKALCESDGAGMMMEHSDRSTVVIGLRQQFTGLLKFWIGLKDTNSDDQFEWNDGTELTFTNWMNKPLVLPGECRQLFPNNFYSTRTITKTGKSCLFWNSAEVQSAINSTYTYPDNYCRSRDRVTANLFCYITDNGQTVKEDCAHIPLCEINQAFPWDFNGLTVTYRGHLSFTHDDYTCVNWSDVSDGLTDEDFVDGSKANARNYCRNFKNRDLHCYDGSKKISCVDPNSCSTDWNECRTHRQDFDGKSLVHYAGTLNVNERGIECKPWANTGYNSDSLFPFDDSAAAASNYCRPLYSVLPWCFDVAGGWGKCNIDKECCEEPSYTRPKDYLGQRSFAWNEKKCLRWDSPALASYFYNDWEFPDGSVSAANNYCRSPRGMEYLFCHVEGGSMEWCDIPIEKNIKDCVYYDMDAQKWTATYCENVYDVVCQMPGEELYTSCSDEDLEDNCRDLFAGNPQKCKDTSTLWGSTRCRKTCGYCSNEDPVSSNTDTCTEPSLNSYVTKVTSSSTVAVGNYFEYSCPMGTVAMGSLKRGCLPDGTLTGTNPSCVDEAQENEWTTKSAIRDRRNQAGVAPTISTLYFSTSKSNTIQKNGYLTAWTYFSLTSASLGLYVLRGNGIYSVVNYTTLNLVQSNREATIELTPPNQFAVQTGDVIGWMMSPGENSLGGIPHDTCSSTYFPDEAGEFLTLKSLTSLTDPVNQSPFTPESENACRIFSFAARVGPFG